MITRTTFTFTTHNNASMYKTKSEVDSCDNGLEDDVVVTVLSSSM